MKIRGVLLRWGTNKRGYRWIDVEGLHLDIGKDRWSEAFLDSIVSREVEVLVQIDWRQSPSGGWFARRKVLAIRPVD
jgi:hypothetical protein